MKKIVFIILLVLTANLYSQEKLNIAVLDLNGTSLPHSDIKLISARLRSELFNTKKYAIIEREKMKNILDEQGFQMSGCTSDECVIEAGKMLGVQQIVAGDVGKIGKLFTINIRMIDIQSGKIVKTATNDTKGSVEEFLTESIRKVALDLAGIPLNLRNKNFLNYNEKKYALQAQAEQQEKDKNEKALAKNYAVKSALLSALIPGAGQAYQKSWWKAAAFAGLEVAFWTANIVYNKKGKDEDVKMRAFGREHWSEQKYWSKIYQKAVAEDLWGADKPQVTVGDDNIILNDYYTPEVISALRSVESSVGTHSLPATRTQQYYEMIYKYLHQFGVGWDDVNVLSDDWFNYYDDHDHILNLTPNAAKYRHMRNLSNDYYVTANTMVILVMVNHIASLFEAGWSGRKAQQKVSYSFRAKRRLVGYEYINTYGLNISW